MRDNSDRRLMAQGFLLIVMALLVGSISQSLPNKRMGLATHLEGLLNGMLLLLLGLLWQRFSLPAWGRSLLRWLPVVGAHCSFYFHLFAAIFPSGEFWMPVAAAEKQGTAFQELVVTAGVITVGLTMLPAMAIAFWGMWREEGPETSTV